jgi:hypothetical protein
VFESGGVKLKEQCSLKVLVTGMIKELGWVTYA